MVDYRYYNRNTVGGFNGATVETAIWANVGFEFNTALNTAVGLWTPEKLGRANGCCSLVMVQFQGTINDGDSVSVIADPSGQTRRSVPASLDMTPWLFLGPRDKLKINAPNATAAGIMVNDLTDEQLQTWILAQQTGSPTSEPLVQVVDADTNVNGAADIIIIAEPPLGSTINISLADAADVNNGRSVTVFRRNGFGGVTVNAASPINDSNEKIPVDGGVNIVKRGGTWDATLAPILPDQVLSNNVADTTVLVPSVGSGFQCYQIEFTARGRLRMPNVAGVQLGTKIGLIRYSDGSTTPVRVQVIPDQVGDRMNGCPNGIVYLNQGDSAVGAVVLAECVEGGWVLTGDRQIDAMQVLTVTGNLTLDSGWVGDKIIRYTGAGNGTLTGPLIANQVAGMGFWLVVSGAGTCTFAPNGITIRADGSTPANIAVAQNHSLYVRFTGSEYVVLPFTTP